MTRAPAIPAMNLTGDYLDVATLIPASAAVQSTPDLGSWLSSFLHHNSTAASVAALAIPYVGPVVAGGIQTYYGSGTPGDNAPAPPPPPPPPAHGAAPAPTTNYTLYLIGAGVLALLLVLKH